jgi:oxygen-independent coproporphyrinogen-3 oxidase
VTAVRSTAAAPDLVGGALEAPPLAGPPVALYVHVPFCVSVCPYCDFVVEGGVAARGPRSRVEPFLRALRAELALRADVLDARWGAPGSPGRPPLATVYLGGGTPSLVPAKAIAALVAQVRARFGLSADAEVTLEADPARDERGEPTAILDAGVTRVSLGTQSLEAAELRRLGRRHSPEEVATAVRAFRSAGMPSIGLDLLYDAPA